VNSRSACSQAQSYSQVIIAFRPWASGSNGSSSSARVIAARAGVTASSGGIPANWSNPSIVYACAMPTQARA
jgi:hypothetical protein